jgi:hypothetical protein
LVLGFELDDVVVQVLLQEAQAAADFRGLLAGAVDADH